VVGHPDGPDSARADSDTAPSKRKRDDDETAADEADADDNSGPEDGPMVGIMSPACTAVMYHDETLEACVALTMALPSGCNSVQLGFNAVGTYALVTPRWPVEMVDINQLYADELATKKMMAYHTLLMALKKALASHTDVVDRIPSTVISVKLPAAVITTDEVEKKVFCSKKTGTMVLIATMKYKNNGFVATTSKKTLTNFNSFAQ